MDIRKTKKEEIKIRNFPDSPGVYMFKDVAGNIIYIGKAASLKKRVMSYFKKASVSYKTDILAASIVDVDYILTASEEEALLLESALIKEKQPKFNVMLKDDKRYPLLKLTLNEDFPRLIIARREKSDGAMYFGPYTNVKLLRRALGAMREIFPLRVCRTMPRTNCPKQGRGACLNYYLGQCIAPCLDKIDKTKYKNIVGDLILFLRGRKKELFVNLSQRMREAAKSKNFEEAARLRDKIRALSSVGKKTNLFSAEKIEGFDVSNVSGKEAVGSMVSFLNKRPDKSNYRRFRIRTVVGVDDYKMMQEVIRRRYTRLLREGGQLPAMIIIDGGKGHVSAARAVLDELHLKNIKLFGIAKNEEKIFSSRGEEKVSEELKQLIQRVRDEAHRFAQNYHHILRRKKTIGR